MPRKRHSMALRRYMRRVREQYRIRPPSWLRKQWEKPKRVLPGHSPRVAIGSRNLASSRGRLDVRPL